MSEPLSNCNMAITDSPTNIGFDQNLGYDISSNSGVQVPSLEPVSEASSNFENITMLSNCNNTEMSNFYLKSEDSMLYSSPKSGTFNTYDNDDYVTSRNSDKGMNSYFHQESNNTIGNSYLSTSTTSKNNENHLSDSQYTNSAKVVRKFHFISAFIPSFVFVVIAMTISAIVVLESDSDLFEQIRNLPEMISLRYQYYQPLKDYILKKVGRKT